MSKITFFNYLYCLVKGDKKYCENKHDCPIKTKFGIARINDTGYYVITSVKEGNKNKLLHRLVFEDFYQIKLSPKIIIHHYDENPLNNEIWNLIPMTREEHNATHFAGKKHTEKTKLKISRANTGKKRSEELKQRLREMHLGKTLSQETKDKISKNNAKTMLGKHHPFETRKKIGERKTQSGVLLVSKNRDKSNKRGYVWRYTMYNNGKRKTINATTFLKLKEKILARGLDWIVLDEEKAKASELL